jgi:hypothetical protein
VSTPTLPVRQKTHSPPISLSDARTILIELASGGFLILLGGVLVAWLGGRRTRR